MKSNFILTILTIFILHTFNANAFVAVEWDNEWQAKYENDDSWQTVESSTDNWIDLSQIFPDAVGSSKIIEIQNSLYASRDGEAVVGFGADWFADLSINDELIFNGLVTGNVVEPLRADNHKFIIPVKAGKNSIHIKIKGGSQGCGFGMIPVIPTAQNLLRVLPEDAFKQEFPDFRYITYGPYLSNPANGAVTVNFVMFDELVGAVDYRQAGTETWERAFDLLDGQARNDVNYCNIRLNNLEPGKPYEYRLVIYFADTCQEVIIPGIHHFTAPPSTEDYTMVITSDLQASQLDIIRALKSINENCGLKDADYYVSLGDIIGEMSIGEMIIFDKWLSNFPAEQIASQPIVFVRGNHDLRGAQSSKYHRYCSTSIGKTYGMFTLGEACFIVLDSMEDKPRSATNLKEQTFFNYEQYLIEEQKHWLQQALKTPEFQNAKFRIVLCHTVEHGNTNCTNYDVQNVRYIVNDAFTGNPAPYKIHLWLAGHMHRYARTIPYTNTLKLVDNFKRVLRLDGCNRGYVTVVNDGPGFGELNWSAIKLHVQNDCLEITAMNDKGEIFDHFSIDQAGEITELPVDLEILTDRADN